jgi:hypothetical protein
MRHLYKEYPKEFYWLWWEYLRRSERYKDFCLKFGTPEQISDPDLDYTFTDNGDVHRAPLNDFENWYQFKMSQTQDEGHQKKAVQINYLDDLMRKKFQEAVTHLTEDLKREPTISEFQDFFFNDWRMMDLSSFVVTPGLYDTGKEISDNVRQWYKGRATRKQNTGYDVLETYLQVYDLKRQGLSIKQIVKEKDLAGNAFINERIYQRYIAKAEAIIRNVEKNNFPGDYNSS